MLPCQGQGWHNRLGKGERRRERERERKKPFSLISVFPCVIRVLMKQVMSCTGAARRHSGEAGGPAPPPPVFALPSPFWRAGRLSGPAPPPPALRCHPRLPRRRSAAPGTQRCAFGPSCVMSLRRSQPCSQLLEAQEGAGGFGEPRGRFGVADGAVATVPTPLQALADPSGRRPPHGRAAGMRAELLLGSGSSSRGVSPVPGHAEVGGLLGWGGRAALQEPPIN